MAASAAPIRPVPGPRGLPLLGNLAVFGRNPLGFMVRLREDFGDFVTWSLGPRRCVLLSHPQHIAELLSAVGHHFEPLDIGWAVHQVAGDSVGLTQGEQWRRKRAMVQPVVRPRMVQLYAETMTDCAIAHADRWRDGDRIDVQEEMTSITQRIVARTLFGDAPAAHDRALREAMAAVQREIAAEIRGGIGLFLPGWVRTPSRRRLLAALNVIDSVLYRLIRARRARPTGGHHRDVLDVLLSQRNAQGRGASDKDVRDEALALWIGGHESTATTLTWTLLALSGAPQARSQLAEELRQVLRGRPPTYADYDRLSYTRQVVQEGLRLYPPVWALCMTTQHDTTLGGIPLPARTLVWCSQWAVHRDPRWFPDPHAFRPERFAADAPDPVTDHAWFPFGSGPRACLGARFAQVEAVLVLAVLAQRFHLDVDPGQVTPQTGAFLQPSGPLHATVRAN